MRITATATEKGAIMKTSTTDITRMIYALFVGMYLMVADPLDAKAIGSEKYFIARGKLAAVTTNSQIFTSARYDLEEVIMGEIAQGGIEVEFYSMALKGALPTEAVLLLESRSSKAPFYAIGKDPALGILPDTPENRARAKSLTEEEMQRGTPVEKQISEDAARVVAEQYLAQMNLSGRGVLKLGRSPYGWMGGWQSDIFRPILLFVGDDGEIKSARHFAGEEVKPLLQEDHPESVPDWPSESYQIKEKKFDYVVLRASRVSENIPPKGNKPIQYRVDEVLQGEMDAGVEVVGLLNMMDVVVQFMGGNPVAEYFPEEAILIVTRDSKDEGYMPLDTLASRGILPATPENIRRVETEGLQSLTENPKEMQLSIREAAENVKRYLTAQNQWADQSAWTIVRMGFGWVFSSSTGRSGCELYVGDDGEVKYHFDVQQSIELL